MGSLGTLTVQDYERHLQGCASGKLRDIGVTCILYLMSQCTSREDFTWAHDSAHW